MKLLTTYILATKREIMTWGIEQIKGGHLYETRYAFSEKWIEPPKVMVMTNTKPSTKELSADRWDFMELTKTGGSLNFTSV